MNEGEGKVHSSGKPESECGQCGNRGQLKSALSLSNQGGHFPQIRGTLSPLEDMSIPSQAGSDVGRCRDLTGDTLYYKGEGKAHSSEKLEGESA